MGGGIYERIKGGRGSVGIKVELMVFMKVLSTCIFLSKVLITRIKTNFHHPLIKF